MRRASRTVALALAVAAALAGCAETVRCPEGQVFDDAGVCGVIPDAGPEMEPDAGPLSDGG